MSDLNKLKTLRGIFEYVSTMPDEILQVALDNFQKETDWRRKCYKGTEGNPEHPGLKANMEADPILLSGKANLKESFDYDYAGPFRIANLAALAEAILSVELGSYREAKKFLYDE